VTASPTAGSPLLERLTLWASVALVVASLSVLASGLMLTLRYRPAGPGVPASELPPAAAWSQTLEDWHANGLRLLALAGFAWLLVSTYRALTGAVPPGRRLPVLATASLVLVGALATGVAWLLVRWEQLALEAVTVGTHAQGLWFAAFSDEVLFVIVGGTEVSQGTYAPWVIAHLAFPVMVLVTAAIGWRAMQQQHEQQPSA
jgi:hypothetical protein